MEQRPAMKLFQSVLIEAPSRRNRRDLCTGAVALATCERILFERRRVSQFGRILAGRNNQKHFQGHEMSSHLVKEHPPAQNSSMAGRGAHPAIGHASCIYALRKAPALLAGVEIGFR